MTSSMSTSSAAHATTQLGMYRALSSAAFQQRTPIGSVPVWSGAGRKFSAYVVGLIFQLVEHGRDDLLVSRPQRRVGLRHIVLDLLVQVRQTVVGHHREHVVLDVVVH